MCRAVLGSAERERDRGREAVAVPVCDGEGSSCTTGSLRRQLARERERLVFAENAREERERKREKKGKWESPVKRGVRREGLWAAQNSACYREREKGDC